MIWNLIEAYNLNMAISMRTLLILLFVLNEIVCNKISIKKVAFLKDEETDTQQFFSYEIYNDEPEFAYLDESYFEPDGSVCFEKGEAIGIGAGISKNFNLRDKFYLSFNSGAYTEHDSYDGVAEGMDCENLCVLWGTWIPSDKNDNKEVSVYFNFIAKSDEMLYESVFSYDLLALKGALSINLRLGSLEFNENDEDGDKIGLSIKLFLLNTKCKETSLSRDQFIFRGISHTHRGDGNFRLSVVVDRSDEDELRKFITKVKNNSGLQKDSMIWGILKCTKETFEFLEDSLGKTGTGLNILI